VLDGVKEQDLVVLDPRNHLDKMEIPTIAEVDDREKLVKIASESPKADAKAGPVGAPAGGPPSGGGMNPDTIAAAMLSRMDTNADGKLTAAEVADNERMKNSFSDYDANKDGSIDLAEIVAQMQKRMAAGGGGGPGGGGGGGSGASRGAPSN
jgi:hypothetical protein